MTQRRFGGVVTGPGGTEDKCSLRFRGNNAARSPIVNKKTSTNNNIKRQRNYAKQL